MSLSNSPVVAALGGAIENLIAHAEAGIANALASGDEAKAELANVNADLEAMTKRINDYLAPAQPDLPNT